MATMDESHPTAEEVSANFDLKGKVCLVTGATSGVGWETARVLAMRNCKVLLGARTMEKGNKAKQDILASIGQDKSDLIEPVVLELGSFHHVRDFVHRFEQRHDRTLHILINNAALATAHYAKTEDGIEQHFAINHVAPILLTLLLLPYLKATALKSNDPSRIIFVSSEAMRFFPNPNIEDYNPPQEGSNPRQMYPFSKLYNLLGSTHLNNLLKSRDIDVISTSLSPGFVETGLMARDLGWEGARKRREEEVKNHVGLKLISLEQGAATQVLLVGEEPSKIAGAWYVRCAPAKPMELADDPQIQKRAWEITENLMGLTFEQANSVVVVV